MSSEAMKLSFELAVRGVYRTRNVGFILNG